MNSDESTEGVDRGEWYSGATRLWTNRLVWFGLGLFFGGAYL